MKEKGTRINKFLTERGVCSRREADKLIESGRVRLNQKKAALGDRVGENDKVYVDGHLVEAGPEKIYIMYNKPLGVTCTTDLRDKDNIVQAVNHPQRVFPIGRLDKYSSGLILLTNDGDIVNQILRAQYGHEKEYVVEINMPVSEVFLKKMSEGVDIGGYVTRPCRIKKIGGNTFVIVLTEGKNRQIRRMCEAMGVVVKDLQRVRIMNIKLGALKLGEWRDVPPRLLNELKSQLSSSLQSGLANAGMDIEE